MQQPPERQLSQKIRAQSPREAGTAKTSPRAKLRGGVDSFEAPPFWRESGASVIAIMLSLLGRGPLLSEEVVYSI